MYQYRLTIVRPSVDIPFYEIPADVQSYISAVWKDTGKMTSSDIAMVDELLSTKLIQFTSEEEFNNFKKDPIIAKNIADRKLYEQEKGIFRWTEPVV